MTTTVRALLATLGVAILSAVTFAQAPASSGVASSAEIQKILAERVDTYRQSVGIVVGVIEPSSTVRSFGSSANARICS